MEMARSAKKKQLHFMKKKNICITSQKISDYCKKTKQIKGCKVD